jgi:hypothetical protein
MKASGGPITAKLSSLFYFQQNEIKNKGPR